MPQPSYVPMTPNAQASDSAASSRLSSLRTGMGGDSGYDSASVTASVSELGRASVISARPDSRRVSRISRARIGSIGLPPTPRPSASWF